MTYFSTSEFITFVKENIAKNGHVIVLKILFFFFLQIVSYFYIKIIWKFNVINHGATKKMGASKNWCHVHENDLLQYVLC